MIDKDQVARALHQAHGQGMSFKQLAEALRVPAGSRGSLRARLLELIDAGRATFDGHRYRPGRREKKEPRPPPAAMTEGRREKRDGASSDVVGVLHVRPEGYGFVTPLTGTQGRAGDLFLPPGDARRALDGDVVRVQPMRGREGRLAGRLVDVVEERRQLCIGTLHLRGRHSYVTPHDRGLLETIPVDRPAAQDGDVVKVRLRRGGEALTGEVVDVLGAPGNPRFEILSALYANGFSDEFDAPVIEAARGVPEEVRPEDLHGRRDLRALALVTIDGEDARDFDDAVFVDRVGSGYRLVVAIADVAHYVREKGALDREALRRGTSVYFPGQAVPMLPERLSNGICSLNAGVDRLCMVCDLALDETGRPQQADLYPAVMRSHARLTYTQVAAAIEGRADAATRPLLGPLRVAHELSRKMAERRRQRGSIDFDLPEAKIVLRDDGTVEAIERRPRNDAHRLVEEFMLAANEAVARFFEARGLPTVYRIHDVPDEEKLAAFAALARASGFALADQAELTPLLLNAFLEELEGKPQQRALHSLLLRAMMQARYSPENIGHYGLAAPTYLHFTSPIRRYPDLIVHRLLKHHWERAGVEHGGPSRAALEERLHGVAAQCSERERAAMKAERDVAAFYAALFMQDHVGETHRAVVCGVTENGLFCQLALHFVEGMLPAAALGDSTELDAELHRLVVGTSGAAYGVGDALDVLVAAADPARRRIELALQGKRGEPGRGNHDHRGRGAGPPGGRAGGRSGRRRK